MPEIEYAVGAAVKTVSEYYVGIAFENGFEQLGIIAGIVLEIGILNEDDVSRGVLESGTQRSALTPIAVVHHQLNAAAESGLRSPYQIVQQLARSIIGKVIDNHELVLERGLGLEYARYADRNRVFLIEDRQHDRQATKGFL
jgi:hypothetical protein